MFKEMQQIGVSFDNTGCSHIPLLVLWAWGGETGVHPALPPVFAGGRSGSERPWVFRMESRWVGRARSAGTLPPHLYSCHCLGSATWHSENFLETQSLPQYNVEKDLNITSSFKQH